MDGLIDFLDFSIFTGTGFEFRVIRIFNFVWILLIAWCIWYALKNWILPKIFKRSDIDVGDQFAIRQILKYVIVTIATLLAIQSLGINLTVIWGAGAALAVGFGLGIQQTFGDLAAGIILLFDSSIDVGDVLDVDGKYGRVTDIGIRTTKIKTFENVLVVLPNSKVIGNKVVNWSSADNKLRFSVRIGVAYGSDTELVRKLLLEIAKKHSGVLKAPKPFVRFSDFGDSALVFDLLYFSTEYFKSEDIKSDLRFAIDKAFRENNVEIPFPQRDLWVRNPRKSDLDDLVDS